MIPEMLFFREKIIFAFWQRDSIKFVRKRNIIFTKYTEHIIFSCIFRDKSSFVIRLKIRSYFREKIASFLIIQENHILILMRFFRKDNLLRKFRKRKYGFSCCVENRGKVKKNPFSRILKKSHLWMHMNLGKKLHTLLYILNADLWFIWETNRPINGLKNVIPDFFGLCFRSFFFVRWYI